MRKVFLFAGIISIFGIALISNVTIAGPASLGFYVSGAGGTTNGAVRTTINYSSTVGTDTLDKDRYIFENHGVGGETMTILTLETPKAYSGNIMATHESYVAPLAGSPSYYDVEEKASSGVTEAYADTDQVGNFQAAVGVGMGVTEGYLGTKTWTDSGATGQTIAPSYGKGMFESGGAAEYSLQQGPGDSVGSAGDPLHSQICPWSATDPSLVYPVITQSIDFGVTQFGNWTYSGTRVFYPQTPQ